MGVSGAELEARRAARLQAAALLRAGRTPLQVVAAAEQAVAVAEAAVRGAVAEDPPRAPAACREGCAWCCYKVVGVAAPEVLRIAAYLRQALSAEELRAARERVTRLAEQRRALSRSERSRARLPCALLVGDRCSAYPVRPLTCRGYNSSDARQCERSLDPRGGAVVPVYYPQQRLHTFVLDGLRAGAAECRLDGELLELTAALEIALAVPDAAARWCAGEAVFAPARLP
jgi:Fe-S-cluster containining protein